MITSKAIQDDVDAERIAAMRIDFTPATTRALTVVLDGLTRPAS